MSDDEKYKAWLRDNEAFLKRFILENVQMSVSLHNERWNSSNELTVEANLNIGDDYCESLSDNVSLEKE